jgi:hypothetical protein
MYFDSTGELVGMLLLVVVFYSVRVHLCTLASSFDSGPWKNGRAQRQHRDER